MAAGVRWVIPKADPSKEHLPQLAAFLLDTHHPDALSPPARPPCTWILPPSRATAGHFTYSRCPRGACVMSGGLSVSNATGNAVPCATLVPNGHLALLLGECIPPLQDTPVPPGLPL